MPRYRIAPLLLCAVLLVSVGVAAPAWSQGAAAPAVLHSLQQRPTVPPTPTAGPPRPTLTPARSRSPRSNGNSSRPAALCLRLLADPNSTVQPDGIVTYYLVAENRGRGTATGLLLTMPLTAEVQTLLDASFSTPGAWVSVVRADEVQIRGERLEPGLTMTATLRLRVRPIVPLGHTITTHVDLVWHDSAGTHTGGSNPSVLGVAATSASKVATPATIESVIDAPSSQLAFTADGFAAYERVSRWYHDETGRILPLDEVQADANGKVFFRVSSSILPSSHSTVVIYGQCSQVTVVGIVRR